MSNEEKILQLLEAQQEELRKINSRLEGVESSLNGMDSRLEGAEDREIIPGPLFSLWPVERIGTGP